MKLNVKIVALSLTVLWSVHLSAQRERQGLKQYEFKLNGISTILGTPEVSFEYLLSNESAIGLYAAVGTSDGFLDRGGTMLTPYHRIYFDRNSHASGFFLETSMSFFTITESRYDPITYSYVGEERELQFGIGFAGGWKWLTQSGWIGDLSFGLGRNLVSDDFLPLYPRWGISIGKRF